MVSGTLIFWGIIVLVVFLSGFRIVQQYERAVRLRFGKYVDTLNPGLRWVLPLMIDRIYHIDIRQRTLDLQKQEVLSKDNVNLTIDGVVFYRIMNAKESFLNVKNLVEQISAKATSELKEIIGAMTMQDALAGRVKIEKELKERLLEAITEKEAPWGATISGVQINNIELPQQLIRAMAKTAEAEREKIARVTKAQGEMEASHKFKEASDIYAKNPIAIRLRELQTYQEIGAEHNSLIIVVPEYNSKDLMGFASLGKDMINLGDKKKKESK